MTHILHIDTSPRVEESHSRSLAQDFVNQWLSHHPDTSVTYRDLGLDPIPYIDATWVAAKFTLPEQYSPEMAKAIALSDQLIDEFLASDRYVLSVPMYNFSIPAVLKSYIDHIVRPRRTFAVTPNGFQGLVSDKKLLVITARGSDFSAGSAFAPFDFQEPFLKTVFNFIGITDIQFIHANALRSNQRDQSLEQAHEQIHNLVFNW